MQQDIDPCQPCRHERESGRVKEREGESQRGMGRERTRESVAGCRPLPALRFRGGLVCKAHRLVYHSTLGVRVIKKKKQQQDVDPASPAVARKRVGVVGENER